MYPHSRVFGGRSIERRILFYVVCSLARSRFITDCRLALNQTTIKSHSQRMYKIKQLLFRIAKGPKQGGPQDYSILNQPITGMRNAPLRTKGILKSSLITLYPPSSRGGGVLPATMAGSATENKLPQARNFKGLRSWRITYAARGRLWKKRSRRNGIVVEVMVGK
jgi:hypothetical protein